MSLPAPASTHFTALNLKSVDDTGVFEGYASLFNREDLGRDIVMPGAFAESLKRRGARGIKMLFQHDPAEPIGLWEHLAEDARGLFARGRLMPEVARAREVLTLMKAGALDGLSIGFKTVAARRDAKSGVRRLDRIDLWEISVVTFPMLPEARIAAVKTGTRPSPRTERDFERWLTQDAGLSRSDARAFITRGFQGFRARQDAAAAHSPAGHARLSAAIRRATHIMHI